MSTQISAEGRSEVVSLAPSLSQAPLARMGRAFQFALLVLAAAVAMLAGSAFAPLQETLRIALDLSDTQMAFVAGPAAALPIVLGAVPIGFMIDRCTRVRLLLVLPALEVAGCIVLAVAADLHTLLLARGIIALATSGTTITVFSLLADLYPPNQRGRAKAVIMVGQYAGTSAAFALGGALLAFFAAPDGWRSTMVWLTAPALTLVILLAPLMREPPRAGVVLKKPPARQVFVELWHYRAAVAPLMIGIVFADMAFYAVILWAAPALARSFSLPPDRVGAIMGTIMIISGVAGPVVGGTLADLCQRTGGPRRTIAVLGGLGLLLSVCAALFSTLSGLTVASILLGTLIMIGGTIMSMGMTLFTIVIPNELRGLCLAVMAAAGAVLGVAVAPVLVSVLSGAIGGPAMIGRSMGLVCMTAGLLCAATFTLGRRRFPQMAT
jgi:predicted MFS family arabinose efflux permease